MTTVRKSTTLPIKTRAENLVTGWNLVKTWSAAGDQLFQSQSVKTLGLFGLWGILVMLVAHFLKWGRALAACELLIEPWVAALPTWSRAMNPVRTSPATCDQVYASGVPKTGGLHGGLNNPVTWSAFAGGVQ
ncbi:MAG: hypothetical protein J0L75_08805 [Spirochaetes bacterium]|nr:hypothetical protein [Spirochaetota bacterium]